MSKINFYVAISWIICNTLFLVDIYKIHSSTDFYVIILTLFSIYYLLSLGLLIINYRLLHIFNILYLSISCIINYFKYHYKVIISNEIIVSIINTDIKEVLELANLSIFFWCSGFIILPYLLYLFFYNKFYQRIKSPFKYYLINFLIIITILSLHFLALFKNFTNIKKLTNAISITMPFSYIIGIKNYIIMHKSLSKTQDINLLFSSKFNSNNSIKVVLVIGESARYDRFGINGYHIDTTPNLAKINNLITYNNVHSLATCTHLGVQAIMLREFHNNHYTSFISIFNKLGFDTYWISNQGIKNNHINKIALEAKNTIFSDDLRMIGSGSNYDTDTLPIIKDIMNNNKNQLIIVHTIGSHRLYDLRYPKEFKKYTPVCIENELYYNVHECKDHEKLNNSYNNSILFTNYFLSELIKHMVSYNSFLIYISDHGESLGENGIYAHAQPIKSAPIEQIHIPLIFWSSDIFNNISDNHIKLENIIKNQDKKIDQGYIFHSILDCTGIESEAIIKNKSICYYNK